MDGEWDEAKRRANIEKHGIDFVDAVEIFAGQFIETEDRRRDYGERRYRAVGQLGEQIIQVAHMAKRAPPDYQRQKGRTE
jgi:uncharacterized DUF497 family protein